jgi:hypothetical protein
MNFDGYTPAIIERFSSMVEADDPTALPLGVAVVARNCRFHLTSVRTRDGIQSKYGFVLPDGGAVTGLVAQKVGGVQGDLQVPLAFSSLGDLYQESPAGSGQVVRLTGSLVNLPAGKSMQAAAAYTKAFLAFGDLKNSAALPAVFNPTLDALDPLSMKVLGGSWQASTEYFVGEVVTPTAVGGNGHLYRCVQSGTSAANAPAFPTGEGDEVDDGSAVWQEYTPVMVQSIVTPATPTVTPSIGGVGFPAGQDVYLVVTLVNGNGETTPSGVYKFSNTANLQQFEVSPPTLTGWETTDLTGDQVVIGYNVYEADVAHGDPAPALSSYALVNNTPVALNLDCDVTATGTGAAPPTVSTAAIVGAGNICSGLRYLVVMFINRNGYISGWGQSAIVSVNLANSGFALAVANIPIGPAGTAARLCAFTPAGQLNQLAGGGISNAGPYFWIPPAFPNGIFNLSAIAGGVTTADVVNGEVITSTLVNDNTTTFAIFNFDDNYLKATTNDVSSYFRKIQVPGISDVFYSQTLDRMFYAADNLQSGWYVSFQADPESVYGDTGIVYAAQNNGQNRTAVREFNGIVYLMKEKSGHVCTPNTGDPNTWDVTQQWTGSGPCGPRAVDVGNYFMCYVHRSGVYVFTGNKPRHISAELPAHTGVIWKNINWSGQQAIWVLVDDETKEIRIGVPYGAGVTSPNIVLKCNYEELPDIEVAEGSWARPIHFSPYIGKEIAAGACYKWSIDDIPANLAIRAERTLQNPPATLDEATVASQILYASPNPDGAVSAITPYQFDDNGEGIDWIYETAAHQDLMRPNQVGGVQMNIGGCGQGSVYLLALRAKDPKAGGAPPPVPGRTAANAGIEIRLKKPWIGGVPYSCGASGQNERWRIRVTNDKRPGSWGDLQWAAIYANPISSARPG